MTTRRRTVEPLCWRVEEVADMLGLSRAKVYLLMDTEGLPSVHFGKARRIPADSLQEWLLARVKQQCEDREQPLTWRRPTPPVVAAKNGTRREK